jgi:hypothetical protein
MSKFPEFVSRIDLHERSSNQSIVFCEPARCRLSVDNRAFVLTLLLYWQDIRRGIRDVGFVGASLRAERSRRWGI